nr:50S ribosomal protein L6 [Coxiella endosymbiont of Amblyomma nuttalli]
MSRVAKSPIEIPAGVDVKIEAQQVIVKGKLGELKQNIHRAVKVIRREYELQLMPICDKYDLTTSNALAGTTRAILRNMIHGVHKGFQRKLVMVGVGYRAKAEGKILHVTVGLSHPIKIEMTVGLSVETPSATEIIIKGADKFSVCQMAANIRAIRPPEPYKGKGIRYDDERVVLKEVKKK